VLREVGGDAVTYCAVGATGAWSAAILALLEERERNPAAWEARRAAGRERAANFSWSRYTADVVALYRALVDAGSRNVDAGR
jgi:glycosyltransferase involved in cell wall biosynthesis